MRLELSVMLLLAASLAGCAHEPTAIEGTLVSPRASTATRSAMDIPAVAALSGFDDADQAVTIRHFNQAMESAPTGRPVTWTNPSGINVQLSATRTFQQADGTYCREFSQTIASGSQPSVAKGTACRQADGGWQIIG